MRAFRAIIVALLVIAGISAAGWALAQEGGSPDFVKIDNNQT
ncbi:MAG: hypothetical protein FD159_2585 [Syntrophaceae bacterium]|nr:MAG: hypothetical protein FD159_2585 [Syntrophaceae bacterium]